MTRAEQPANVLGSGPGMTGLRGACVVVTPAIAAGSIALHALYSSDRPDPSRSRSYRLFTGNAGSQDSRRTVQSSYVGTN